MGSKRDQDDERAPFWTCDARGNAYVRRCVSGSALVWALGLSACGGGLAHQDTTALDRGRDEAARAALRARVTHQKERIRELEARVALAEAESRDLREEFRLIDEREPPAAPVQASDAAGYANSPQRNMPAEQEPDESDSGSRPVLTLYGERPSTEQVPRAPLEPVPVVAERLPLSPLPDISVTTAPPQEAASAPAPQASQVSESDAVQAYRRALMLVKERRFDVAKTALKAFLRVYANHPYADNATYWLGEVLYALRDYTGARATFEGLLSRYPNGGKVPDALVKLGYCHLREGQPAEARRYFTRVVRNYPGTLAARLSADELKSTQTKHKGTSRAEGEGAGSQEGSK